MKRKGFFAAGEPICLISIGFFYDTLDRFSLDRTT